MDTSRLQIRRGTRSDAAALAQFALRTFVETFGAANEPEHLQAHLKSAFGIEQQTRELEDALTITLLAHLDDTLVSFAQVRSHARPACVVHDDAIELHRFYVDRPAHGLGIAQRMMAAVHDAARTLGARHVWLGVWERNPRAIAFYTKCGFVDVGAHTFVVGGDPQTDRVMLARISDESSLAQTAAVPSGAR
jgi:GNAT superfamily N-acetyltransferase